MIARSRAARSPGGGWEPSRTAMTVWMNRARRVRVSALARPAAGRSNGFRGTPGAPRCTYAPPPARAGAGRGPGRRGGGRVDRVQVPAGRAQVHVRAADGAGEAGVLVFGVDHVA